MAAGDDEGGHWILDWEGHLPQIHAYADAFGSHAQVPSDPGYPLTASNSPLEEFHPQALGRIYADIILILDALGLGKEEVALALAVNAALAVLGKSIPDAWKQGAQEAADWVKRVKKTMGQVIQGWDKAVKMVQAWATPLVAGMEAVEEMEGLLGGGGGVAANGAHAGWMGQRRIAGRSWSGLPELLASGDLRPEWLEADQGNFKFTVKMLPARSQITTPMDEQLVVELYSK